ncbi:putative L-cysteine:1D-myo-inosityl 2-amino-2-deoxy-alpha-D-glucopyranoside ligase MshC [Streptomyces misionensis JCM 4497]
MYEPRRAAPGQVAHRVARRLFAGHDGRPRGGDRGGAAPSAGAAADKGPPRPRSDVHGRRRPGIRVVRLGDRRQAVLLRLRRGDRRSRHDELRLDPRQHRLLLSSHGRPSRRHRDHRPARSTGRGPRGRREGDVQRQTSRTAAARPLPRRQALPLRL